MQEEATQLLFQIKFHFYLKLISLEVNNAFKHCDLLLCWSDWRTSVRGWCEFPYHHVAISQRSCTGHAHSTLCYGSGNGPFLCPDWLLNRLNLCVSEIQFVCICWQMYSICAYVVFFLRMFVCSDQGSLREFCWNANHMLTNGHREKSRQCPVDYRTAR